MENLSTERFKHQKERRTMTRIMEVKHVVLHTGAHWDELASLWLAKTYGQEAFPGIESADIQYWNEVKPGMTEQQLVRAGYLLLGIGYGQFDDKIRDGERKEGECTVSLIVKALGLEETEWIKKLTGFSLTADTQSKVGYMDPASQVKLLNGNHPDNPEVAQKYVSTLLDEMKIQQDRFFGATADEYHRSAYIKPIRGFGKNFLFVAIESDSPDIMAYARSAHGGKAGVLLKRGKDGTQIYFDPRLGLGKEAEDLIRSLRVAENNLNPKLTWNELGQGGQLSDDDRWYGMTSKGEKPMITMIANSTKTRKKEPTEISLEIIQELILICIQPGFESKRKGKCEQNICEGRGCPWYNLGLSRCRNVRFKQKQSRPASKASAKPAPEEELSKETHNAITQVFASAEAAAA